MLDLDRFAALTFDCYGTLIDWEAGLAAALGELVGRRGVEADRDELLELHARFEPAVQADGFRPYREVLAQVVDRFGGHYGFQPTAEERASLAESIRDWPAFPDTVAALEMLSKRYRLGILSNIDDDLFAHSARRLEVDFAAVVTAQAVRSYKPARGHFDAAPGALGLPRESILHVAQSLFHDVAPARALGYSTVWVNRRKGLEGAGATPPSDATPDLEVATLAELAERVERAAAPGAG